MMNTARFAIVLMFGVAAGSCDWFWGYEDVPLYCKQDADCTYAAYPNATFCDVDGTMQGVKNRCIEEPVVACESSDECTLPDEPICDPEDSVCRACEAGASGDAECATATSDTAPHCLDGTCVECVEGVDCGAGTPICDSVANTCQPCTGSDQCAAQHPGQPICSATGACVECAEHADCNSQVCNVDTGTCVDEGDIIYVDGGTGTDGATCGTTAMPCKTIGGTDGGLAKVTEQRSIIKVANGDYYETISVSGGEPIILVGPATISPLPNANTPVILVDGAGDVTVDMISLSNATGGNDADGARCQGASSLRLIEVTIADNRASGIETINCSITIERSTIRGNQEGGILISNSSFILRNILIQGNGTGGAGGTLYGGVLISNLNGLMPQVFDFNTVADNFAQTGAASAGVRCDTMMPMTASSNIVYLTTGGMNAVAGTCAWSYSNIEGGTPGTGNIDMDPLFVDPVMGDFHLRPDSPCRDMADPAATLERDFDGDIRPQGAGRDMGADEIVDS